MDSPTVAATSLTYQCVVCQSTCLTPNELHRHQSYRHTSEELSLSIMGVHNAAIRIFDLPNGIVYDNSWLYDPNRHAEFYTYSANMLCDDNNNGRVVDYAFKAFADRVIEESGPADVPHDEDCTHDLDRCIDEKYENEIFLEAQNFEQESLVGESKILDLRLKIDLEIETEIHMDTARDNFSGCGEGHSADAENLEGGNKKSASSETCMKSLNFEKLQTCLASKILDLGQRVFSENRMDTAADDFGKCYEGSQPWGNSANLGRDADKKSKDPQIEICVKVQNFDDPQSCVQESEILDLSQTFCSKVQPETRMDMAAANFGKCYKEFCSDVGNLRGQTAKCRSSLNTCPAKSRARTLTTPRKKLDSPKKEAAKPEISENRDSGNVDSVKQASQESQDSLSWFASEALKIQKFNDKIKQIRSGQKKALDLTKAAWKQVKGEGSGKAKKRSMQSCGKEDSVRASGNFDSEDLLGFDGKGAMINASYSKNAKRPRVSRKKEKICEPEANKSAEETSELLKKPLEEETAGETGITWHRAEHSSALGSDQSLFKFKTQKSKIHAPPAEKAKKPRVSWKKGKMSKTEADNSTELTKRAPMEENAGETEITLHSAEHSSIIGSDQSVFDLESSKSKIHATTSENAKKSRVSKKKRKISETEVNNSADLQKKQRKEETAGETEITLHRVEHSSIICSDQTLINLESSKSKIHTTTSGNAKKPRGSKKKEKISETEADNSAKEIAELLKLFEEETDGETLITQNQDNGNGNCAELSSIFSSDKYSSHFERKKSQDHATTAGNSKKPRVSKKRENISETEADDSADETAELLKKLFEEETAGETLITQNQDNENGNRAESNSIFASAESTFHFASKEPKIDAASSVNAKNPIASKRKAKNLEVAAEEPAKRESKKPANQNCEKEVVLQTNWVFKSEDLPACLDGDRTKINEMCAENAGAQAENTLADKPAEQESTEATEKDANQNCAKEAGLQSNWDFESPDFLACSDGQKINTTHAEYAGAKTENAAVEVTAELLRDLVTEPSEEETPRGTEKLQNQDYENGNCAKQSSIFGSAASTIRFESKEAKIDAGASGSAKKPIASMKKAPNPKTVADEPTERETTKPANQNCAKGVGPRSNWRFESADFLACSGGDVQNVNATCAESGGAQEEKAAIEVTTEPLRDLLSEPFEEETPRMTEKLKNEDCGNEDYAVHDSFISSDEYLYYFPSEEAKMAAMSSGYAKKPIASGKKSNDLTTVTVLATKQKMSRKIVNDGNGNLSKQNFGSSRDVYSYTGSETDEATITPSVASGKKSNDLKTATVWAKKQKMTRKIVNDGNGNLSKQNSGSSRDVYSYTGSETDEATITPSVASGKKPNDLKTATVLATKQKMSRKIVNDGNGNLSKQNSGSSRDVFSYTGSETEEATITASVASGKKSNDLKTATVWAKKQKMTRKIVNDGNGNLSKQNSGSSRDVFSYTGSESEEATITPLSKFRAERSSALGKKLKKINGGDENCAGRDSNFVSNIYTCTDRATKKVKTLNSIGKKPKKINPRVGNCAEHNSNFVPNIYTCTDRASKQVEIEVPSAGKAKKRQVTRKKSKNSERVSDKAIAEKTAGGPTKLFYQDFGSEMFVSQNSPPIIDVNSPTESGSKEEMSKNPPEKNLRKSIAARHKTKNLKTPEVEPAVRHNSENQEHDNVISLYKDSVLIPGSSSACDNELPPVTFIAYPPYVDENSILVLNPESRELVWRCLETDDSQLDEMANFHWLDRGSRQNFPETGKATSRNVDTEKSASFVPAAIGAPAANEESTLQRTNIVRRSTRPRKVIQRYNS